MNHSTSHQSTLRRSGFVVGLSAAAAMVAIGVPLALAAPTAAPPSDAQGYVDSTARCAKPSTAVLFGATDTSRVAICQTADGAYQYRGVRVSDGAKLILAATKTGGNTFVVKNDGATYTVTPQALSVTVGGDTFRTETWTDYHGPQAPASTSGTAKSSTTTSSATTSGTATSTSGTATSATSGTSAPKTSAATSTSATPLPPPLPAEVGAGTSDSE
ncbi:MAG TPA: hypothetical protein PKK01_06135 [Mycobacterium sp.]|nr:hypothetical protein [Mycobacterium sp.]